LSSFSRPDKRQAEPGTGYFVISGGVMGRGPPIRLNRSGGSVTPGFTGADSMPAIATDLIRAVPSIVPSDIPAMSDDECLVRLAQAVEAHDAEHLDEVARLIARLAVAIE
jgi:hypothetical protein